MSVESEVTLDAHGFGTLCPVFGHVPIYIFTGIVIGSTVLKTKNNCCSPNPTLCKHMC